VQGFLNLNKPAGLTSHDCVARVRRLLKLKRVGHGGTLDPAATGVLPIALGTATRLLQFLASDKAYRATIRFGMVTATDDLAGEVLHQVAVAGLDRTTVEFYLPRFLGSIQQVPPRYSAIQVQGKRLYDLARAGEMVEVPVRTVQIYSIEICDWRPGDFPELDVEIACGAGTYIRSIARDWGAALGTGGTLAALTRTRSSGFNLQDSVTLDELRDRIEQNAFAAIAPDLALRHLPAVTLPDETARRWCQGQKIIGTEAGGLYRIQDATETLLGIAESIESEAGWLLRQRVVLAQSAADSKA
jgi:tRNA pseudouridine55 synthase